jgi:hypothetical protein
VLTIGGWLLFILLIVVIAVSVDKPGVATVHFVIGSEVVMDTTFSNVQQQTVDLVFKNAKGEPVRPLTVPAVTVTPDGIVAGTLFSNPSGGYSLTLSSLPGVTGECNVTVTSGGASGVLHVTVTEAGVALVEFVLTDPVLR